MEQKNYSIRTLRELYHYTNVIKGYESEILNLNGKIRYIKEKINNLIQSRNIERENIGKEICDKLNQITASVQHRILNIYRLYNSDKEMTNSELKFYDENILNKLPLINNCRSGNIKNKVVLTINLPCKNFGSLIRCINLDDIIEFDLQNKLMNIKLIIEGLGNYIYPLTSEESLYVFDKFKSIGIDIQGTGSLTAEYDNLLQDYEKTLAKSELIYNNNIDKINEIDPSYFGNIITITFVFPGGEKYSAKYNVYSNIIEIFRELMNGKENMLIEYYPAIGNNNFGNLLYTNVLRLLYSTEFKTNDIQVKFKFTNYYEYNSIIYTLKYMEKTEYSENLLNFLLQNINNVKSYANFFINDEVMQLSVNSPVTAILFDFLENNPKYFKTSKQLKFPYIVVFSETGNTRIDLIKYIDKSIKYFVDELNNDIKLIGLINPYNFVVEFLTITEIQAREYITKIIENSKSDDPYAEEVVDGLNKAYDLNVQEEETYEYLSE